MDSYNSSNSHSVLRYNVQNYSVIFNENEPSSLLIDLHFEPSSEDRPFLWRHNGDVIDDVRNSRTSIQANGSLLIDPVRPQDAGSYEITAIISNGLGCERSTFMLYVECEYYS